MANEVNDVDGETSFDYPDIVDEFEAIMALKGFAFPPEWYEAKRNSPDRK